MLLGASVYLAFKTEALKNFPASCIVLLVGTRYTRQRIRHIQHLVFVFTIVVYGSRSHGAYGRADNKTSCRAKIPLESFIPEKR